MRISIYNTVRMRNNISSIRLNICLAVVFKITVFYRALSDKIRLHAIFIMHEIEFDAHQ